MTCQGLSYVPRAILNSRRKQKSELLLYYLSTDHIHSLIYIKTYHTLKEMTPMVVAKVFQLTMMKERGRMGRALTIARTETPSQAETRTLPLTWWRGCNIGVVPKLFRGCERRAPHLVHICAAPHLLFVLRRICQGTPADLLNSSWSCPISILYDKHRHVRPPPA